MTTDITELAQREKFEAWARSQQLSLAYGDCGYVYSSTEMAWRAVKALSAELVEALETKDADAEWMRKRIAELEMARELKEIQRANWFQMAQKLGEDLDVAEKRIADRESRTVTVKLLDCDLAAVQHMSGGTKDYCNGFVDGTQNAIRAMRSAGVDVREDE